MTKLISAVGAVLLLLASVAPVAAYNYNKSMGGASISAPSGLHRYDTFTPIYKIANNVKPGDIVTARVQCFDGANPIYDRSVTLQPAGSDILFTLNYLVGVTASCLISMVRAPDSTLASSGFVVLDP
jgi:hypothetical protein